MFPFAMQGQVPFSSWGNHFNKYKQSQNLPDDYNQYVITSAHQSRTSEIIHVYLRQTWNNIEIVDGNMSLHVNKDGKLVSLNDRFIQNLSAKIEPVYSFSDISDIIEGVWDSMGIKSVGDWKIVARENNPSKHTEIKTDSMFNGNVSASLKYVLNQRQTL